MTEPTVRVVQRNPLGATLAVPTPDGRVFAAEFGKPVEVPVALAGREPGPWVPLADGEAPDLDDGTRLWAQGGDGGWLWRDPGAGLLAQDAWSLADDESDDLDDSED
jgi:hypothetical protein